MQKKLRKKYGLFLHSKSNPTPRIALFVRPSVTEKDRIVLANAFTMQTSSPMYDAWVTRLERTKGAKDEVKQARRGLKGHHLQSGASSPAKHGGAYFSAVYGVMKDPIAALGPYENQEP